MAKTKSPSSASQLQQELNQLGNELGGSGGAAAPGTSGSPSALGITAADSTLPVTFSLPHATTAQTAAGGVPGAQHQPDGSVVTTYAGAVEALYKMDKEQVAEAQGQLIDAGYLSSTQTVDGAVNTATLNAWKRMALDAANSGTPISTLLAAQGAAPALVAAQKAAHTALQNAETNYAEVKTGTATLTDPNTIKQAVISAYASIGETPPSPQLLDSFATAFQNLQEQAAASPLEQVKSQEGQQISQLSNAETQLQQGNLAGGTSTINATESQPGPIDVGTKAPPNLDAEAMAQAKASNPSQYLATQSSYLYGLLLNSIRGTPSYQTAPTAPSQTAPGGADIGTPLVPVGA